MRGSRRALLGLGCLLALLLPPEVRAQAQPVPRFELERQWSDPWAGETTTVNAWLRDAAGEPLPGGTLRWSVSGVTTIAERSAITDEDGGADLEYTAPRSGEDTVFAYHDEDRDAIHDDGELSSSVRIRWRQAKPPSPTYTTIDASPLDLTVSSAGYFQARHPDARSELFDYGETASGFFLYFTGGPLTGKGFGHWPWMPFYSEAQSPPVRTGDSVAQETSFTVRHDDVDYVRVRQTIRYRDGESTFRVTYRVENLTDAPVAYRAGTGGHLVVNGAEWGPAVKNEEPPRFVGGADEATGIVAGIEEVTASRLPGEAVPVPVAPWAVSRHGYWADVMWMILHGEGLSAMTETDADHGVGVEWHDHETRPLQEPLETARYEVVWHVRQGSGGEPVPSPSPTVTPTPEPPAPSPTSTPSAPSGPSSTPPRLADTSAPHLTGPNATPSVMGATLDRRGRLAIRLRCRAASSCIGALNLLSADRRRLLAVVRYRLRTGSQRRYRVRPSRRARSTLRRVGARRGRVLVRYGATGRTTLVTLRLTTRGE